MHAASPPVIDFVNERLAVVSKGLFIEGLTF
jgi:hypothetical protein